MIITHEREKLLNAIIFFIKKTKYCGKTKLFKLLYFADFMHFRETGRSITGLEYNAWQHGPYPETLADKFQRKDKELFNVIAIIPPDPDSNNSFTNIKTKAKVDTKYFTQRELHILENVAEIFKEALAEQIREASHLKNQPWDVTIKTKGERAKIDYMLAVDNSKGALNIDEIRERMKEHAEITKIFAE